MAYGTIAGVEALLPGMGSAYTSTSTPLAPELTAWIDQGAAIINRKLAAAGYSAPVSSGAAVYAELVWLNNWFAAALAKQARSLDSATGDGETQSAQMLAQFDARLADLCSSDLSGVGVTLATTTGGRRPRLRSTQMRRVDGYSAAVEGTEYPYDYPAE